MFRNDKGKLVIRPGYEPVTAGANPGSRIMGVHYFRNAAGTDKTVAATQTGLWQYDGTDWVDITEAANALTGSTTDHVRFQVFPVSGTYNIYLANGADIPKVWDGAAADYADVANSPGTAIDCKAAANRMLWLVAPDNLRVSDFNNPEVLPTGNGFNIRLPDAGDLMVGMEQGHRTSVEIFGERSQYIALAQAGSSPFRIERVSQFPGPVSAAAIVSAKGLRYYLGEDLNVYRFDGVQCIEVGWPMKKFVEENMNYANRKMTHGVFWATLQKVVWIFPGVGQAAPNLGIFIDVRTGEMGRLRFGASITASGQWRSSSSASWASLSAYTWETIDALYPSWDAAGNDAQIMQLFGDIAGTVHVVGRGDGSDNGAAINAAYETPLKAHGGLDKNFTPSTLETWFTKTTNSTMVSLAVGYSNHWMQEPAYVDAGSFDISAAQRNDIDLAAPLSVAGVTEARFHSFKHSINATHGQVEWLGAALVGEPTELEKGPTNV